MIYTCTFKKQARRQTSVQWCISTSWKLQGWWVGEEQTNNWSGQGGLGLGVVYIFQTYILQILESGHSSQATFTIGNHRRKCNNILTMYAPSVFPGHCLHSLPALSALKLFFRTYLKPSIHSNVLGAKEEAKYIFYHDYIDNLGGLPLPYLC